MELFFRRISDSKLSQQVVKQGFILCLICFWGQELRAQNCATLYIITGVDGKIYSINVSTGSKTLVTTMTSGKENLAVGPNPTSTGTTVFTTSQTSNGATVYKTNATIGTILPASVSGLTANPATSSATVGYVYGISKTRQLIQASPAPAVNLGTITGDPIWTNGTISGDVFFDNTGNLLTIINFDASRYLYKIDIATLVATQQVQLSSALPLSFQGLAYLNNKIYAGEVYTTGVDPSKTYRVQLYEINPNTGQGTTGASITFGSTNIGVIDLSTCDFFVPPVPVDGPTCNQLFGIVATTQTIYRFDPTTLVATAISDGDQTNQHNMAYGPIPGNLTQNQFVTSPGNASGLIYKDVNHTGILSSTGYTWASPIGLGTDPATGIVWGVNAKDLTKWTGSGNGISVGVITGDAIWTSGTTCNDIAVDAGGNLYCLIFYGANTYLYRINPTTLVAKLVVQATGTFITNGTSTNANGLAYVGDFFYYSRINGANTDVWKLNAKTGASVSVGSIAGLNILDLGSCATVTNVPAEFAFNCAAPTGGLQEGKLFATGGSQTNILRVPITTTITGLATFTVTGTGITANPSAYEITVAQNALYVDIPIIYDGLGSTGTRALTIIATGAIITGTCAMTIPIDACSASTYSPLLSATAKTNSCPATTVDLSTLTASNKPEGTVVLTWHTGFPATTANKLSNVTALTDGTYYAAFYDSTNECYSGANGAAITAVTATVVFCCNTGSIRPPLNKN